MAAKRTCPYNQFPGRAFWKTAVARPAPSEVNPAMEAPFRITPDLKIATAGSCFAQHIARYLGIAGVAPFVTEPPPLPLDDEVALAHQYGVYSARYGNIYTARQLVQLFDRAFGKLAPIDSAWEVSGRFYDPYRPSIEPQGFHSLDELECDRQQHYQAVQRLFKGLDVFIYTLGLTEAWVNREDGMVYPVCPGCGWGTFDEARHTFVNFDVNQVVSDLGGFLARLSEVNSEARVILTVSPVPLAATAGGQHVLSATTLSKSVLRAAADMVERCHRNVTYFPSYEIISGAYSRGRYFAEDLRSVLPGGVEHVMKTFFASFMPDATFAGAGENKREAVQNGERARVRDFSRWADIICEESKLAPT